MHHFCNENKKQNRNYFFFLKRKSQSPKPRLWATNNRRVGLSHTTDPHTPQRQMMTPSPQHPACPTKAGRPFPENKQVISPQLFPPFVSEISPQHRSLPRKLEARTRGNPARRRSKRRHRGTHSRLGPCCPRVGLFSADRFLSQPKNTLWTLLPLVKIHERLGWRKCWRPSRTSARAAASLRCPGPTPEHASHCPGRQKCQLTARVAARWPGAPPARPRALLGVHLHPVSGAQGGDQGSSSRNPSGRRTQPRQSAAGPPRRSASTPPQPLAVAGGSGWQAASFSRGGLREPPRGSEGGPGSLGEVIPGREFPPLLESRTSPSQKAPSAPAVAGVSGQSGDPPAPSLGTASFSPMPTLAARPHQGGFMHAPSLLTNVRVSDPAAASGEAPTPGPAKPRLRKAGRGGRRGTRDGRSLTDTAPPPPPHARRGDSQEKDAAPGSEPPAGAPGAAGRAKEPTQVR